MDNLACPQCETEREDAKAACEHCGWNPTTSSRDEPPQIAAEDQSGKGPGKGPGKRVRSPESPGASAIAAWVSAWLLFDAVGLLALGADPLNSEIGMLLLPFLLWAQFSVVNLWVVLGPGKFLVRWLWGFAVVSLGVTLVIGIMFTPNLRIDRLRILVDVLPTFPLTMLAAQSVFGATRVFFGWHFVHRDSPQTRGRQFQIRDVMTTTALIAVAIAAFQLSYRNQANAGPLSGEDIATTALMGVGFAAGWSLAFVLPLVFAVGLPRSAVSVAVWSLVGGLLVPIVALTAFMAIAGPAGAPGTQQGLIFVGVFLHGGLVFLTQAFARGHGYRLVRT